MSRYASRFNKRDDIEAEGVQAIGQLGVEWIEGGPLDGWCWLGQWVPVEWKTGNRPLTKGQKEFVAMCNLYERPYRIWRTPLEAIESVQAWRKTPNIIWHKWMAPRPAVVVSVTNATSQVNLVKGEDGIWRHP